ncbi:MAG: RHS repeat-associated core domain-containing protein [Bacillota bacterium]
MDPIGLEDFWVYTEDGVNPANGNLVLVEKDLSIPGRGIPVSISRTFNSRASSQAGIFGYGWTSNLEVRLLDAGSESITLIDGDNTRHIFVQTTDGSYEAPKGIYLKLGKNIDETYTITQKDGTKINFASNGRVTSIVDTNGNTTRFNYNADGKLSTVVDASNRATSVIYGANGYVASITDPANRTVSYEYDAAGNLIQVTDSANKITVYSYDSDHNVIGRKDARNISTTIQYDLEDRVSSISRPITIDGVTENSTTSYVYDTANMLTSVTDGEGRRVDYTYNTNGNVVQVTANPLNPENKAVTTFSYDQNNNLVEVKDPNNNKANGSNSYMYSYDSNGNITSEQLPENQKAYFTYDSKNNLTKEQDFKNNTNLFNYDLKNNQISSVDPLVQAMAKQYDSHGNLVSHTQPLAPTDNILVNPSFEIDSNNDGWPENWTLIREGGYAANKWETAYVKFGKKSYGIGQPIGRAILRSSALIPYYSGDKYVLSAYVKTLWSISARINVEFYNSSGQIISYKSSGSVGGDVNWTRLVAVVDSVPIGTTKIGVSVEAYQSGPYQPNGWAYFDGVQLEKGTSLSAYNLVENSSFEQKTGSGSLPDYWQGNVSSSDGLDQNYYPTDDKVIVGSKSFKINGQSGWDKYIMQTVYPQDNRNSNPITLSGWSKQVGASENGGEYQLIAGIFYTDGTVDWSYAKDFSKTVSSWQHVALEIKPVKAINYINVYYRYKNQAGTAWFDAIRLETGAPFTKLSYDTNNNYVTNITDPYGNNVSYTYDAAGNRTSIKDGKNNVTSFSYDNRDLLTQVTDVNQKTTSYEYDEAGNRISVTDAKNNITRYEYNEFNLVSRIINPLNQSIQFGYDLNGNTTRLIFPKGDVVSYAYDSLNRLEKVLYNDAEKWRYGYDANGNVTSVTDAVTGNTTTYSYDKNNRATQQATGASNTISYAYDANGNVTSLAAVAGTKMTSHDYTYNALDQLVSMVRNGSNVIKFSYDERGNLITIDYANGYRTLYEYDAANRISRVNEFGNSHSALSYSTYQYDANGSLISVTNVAGGSFTNSFKYDSLNRLIEYKDFSNTYQYEYDEVGNRTKETILNSSGIVISSTTYSYDQANQLTTVNGQAYTYDANGNLTSNGSKTFSYDEENRLIEVKDFVGVSLAKFTYDDAGKRTSMTTSSGTIYYHYSGDKVVLETDANNNILAEYTWDDKGNPITFTKNGATYYYHRNVWGDVTLRDSTGAVIANYGYDPWGKIISTSGTLASANTYRYRGYRYDEVTGLYYLGARYYDPLIGRFISRDTMHGFKEDPQSLNLYAYVQNNPIMSIDPDGHVLFVLSPLGAAYLNAIGVSTVGAIFTAAAAKELTKPRNNEPSSGIVYLRTVTVNGKVEKYVGSTKDPDRYKKRQSEHKYELKNKYGEEVVKSLRFQGLEENIKLSQLKGREQWHIINQGGLKRNGGVLQNKINAVSPNKWGEYQIL